MTTRELPRVWVGSRQFYADDRLQEFRAVDNPHERIPYTDDAPFADQGGDPVIEEGEGAMKTTSAAMRDLEANRDVSYTRKPTKWADVLAMVKASALPTTLPRVDADAIDGLLNIVPGYEVPQYFRIRQGRFEFLVNTEGYDYVRYAARIVEG